MVFNTIKNLIITLAFTLPISDQQTFFKEDIFRKPPLSHYKP
jgi:hypothetical protein